MKSQSEFWQRFLRTFGESAEMAVVGLLVAACVAIGSVMLIVHWLTAGRYAAAVGLVVAIGSIVGICVRDYRRGQWSVLSGILMTIWILLIIAGVAYGFWVDWRS
jgi:hypothetical protein